MPEREQPVDQQADGGFSEADKLRHILENSEEYKQQFEERPQASVITGDDTLSMVALLRGKDSEFRDRLGIDAEQAEVTAQKILTDKVAELADLLSQNAVGTTGEKAREHTLKLLRGLPEYAAKYGEVPQDATEALGKIKDAETAQCFLAAHFVEARRETQERRLFTGRVKEQFADGVMSSIGGDGIIPEEYRSLIYDRIGRTEIEFFDVFEMMKHNTDGARGAAFYDAEHQLVIVDPDLSDGMLQHTLTHELFHAISGKTLQQSGENGSVRVQRQGLEITGREGGPVRFKWLNEAITEKLTMMLLGREKSPSYPHEREGLDELGVSFGLLLEAYLEGFENVQGEKVPAWKRLNDELDRKYGPGFLTKLDHEIQGKSASGIRSAIRRAAVAA